MTLAARVSELASAIGALLKASVVPRLLPPGGATGQVLVKAGAGDFQATWADADAGAQPDAGAAAVARLQRVVRASPIMNGGALRVMPSARRPTVRQGADWGELPSFPNYYRRWLGGPNAHTGEPTLAQFIVGGMEGWTETFGGGVTFSQNDGSATVFYSPRPSTASAQWAASCTLAFHFDGRYLAIPTRHWSWQIIVDDEVFSDAAPAGPSLAGGLTALTEFDFGSRGWRKVVLKSSQDAWVSELVAQVGDTLIPLTDEELGLRMNASTDSYGQNGSYAVGGLSYIQMIGALLGAPAGRENAIGGTGWAQPNEGDVTAYPALTSAERMADMVAGSPDLNLFHVGLNDAFPVSLVDGASTEDAIASVLGFARAENQHTCLLALAPIVPSETAGQNPAGAAQQVRAAVLRQLANVAGPWVFIDPLNGEVRNSDGAVIDDGDGPWLTGNGTVSAPGSAGNTDLYVGDDGAHPEEPAGYLYLSRRIASAAAKGILALNAPAPSGGGGAGGEGAAELTQDLFNVAGSVNLDAGTYRGFRIRLAGDATLSFAGATAAGTVSRLLLQVDSVGHALTWPANLEWSTGAPPYLSPAGKTLIEAISLDGGANWIARVVVPLYDTTLPASLNWRFVFPEATPDGYMGVREIAFLVNGAAQETASLVVATWDSGHFSSRVAANLFDGVLGSLSEESEWTSAGGAPPQWVQVQFSSMVTADTIRIYHNSLTGNRAPPRVEVQTSDDGGATWVPLKSIDLTSRPWVSGGFADHSIL